MRIILILCLAVLLSSCASDPFSRRFPDSSVSERRFVKFLSSRNKLTPWEVRSYLEKEKIRFKLKQNSWEGQDIWQIEGCGVWISDYTGKRGEPQMIPMDLSLFYSQSVIPKANQPFPLIPLHADHSMFVLYDKMTEGARGFTVNFSRQTNKIHIQQDGISNGGYALTHRWVKNSLTSCCRCNTLRQ